MHICHLDLTKKLNGCKKIFEYMGENLNLSTIIALLYRNLRQILRQSNLNFESGHLNFTKFQDKNLNDVDNI